MKIIFTYNISLQYDYYYLCPFRFHEVLMYLYLSLIPIYSYNDEV